MICSLAILTFFLKITKNLCTISLKILEGANFIKRVILIVLDSVGIGEMPDSVVYGDEGSNTLKACSKSKYFNMPNMKKLGLFNIDGVNYGEKEVNPTGSFAKMAEQSSGKDTIIGHWEIAGIHSKKPMPLFPNGFPNAILNEFKKLTGKNILCGKPYSGTKVLEKHGKQSVLEGSLIVYTSGDSVFQIAAHEDVTPIDELYEYSKIARKILTGDYAVGRVIARPFAGEYPNYKRTPNRKDFALEPPKITMLNQLETNGFEVIGIGKINDIFVGKGITRSIKTQNNNHGINETIKMLRSNWQGLCFVNLVDFDMLYGHRNDVDGYAKALSEFDKRLPEITKNLKPGDILIITADHGCDPSTASTDHSREHTPMVIFGSKINAGINLGTRSSFSDIGATILEYFNINQSIAGKSFLSRVIL